MKLAYFLGAGGVEWWRCRIPALALQRLGLAEVRILEKRWMSAKEIGETLAWCDAVIVASPQGIESFVGLMKYKSLGKKIFVDYDDYTFECSPFNPAYKVLGLEEVYTEDTQTGEKLQIWKDGVDGFDIKRNYMGLRALTDILNNCDLVTTTTLYLKNKWTEHVQDPTKIKVLPNAIDFNRWKPVPDIRSKYADKFRIGYVCSASHADDWMKISPALEYFLDKHLDAKLVLMGDVGWDISKKFRPEQLEWHSWSNLLDGHYMMQVASLGLDVAIMPLAPLEFNKCKSPLKYAEMTAFGYPVIAQRMLPYTEDIRHGDNGLLAGSTEEWVSCLKQLYDNPDLGKKLRFNALLTCKEWYDIDKVAYEWAKVYSEALGEMIYEEPRPLERGSGLSGLHDCSNNRTGRNQ